VPIMFVCQHCVCKPCLGQLLDAHHGKDFFPCPKCRQKVDIKPQDAYQKSLILVELLEKEKQERLEKEKQEQLEKEKQQQLEKERQMPKCQEHPEKPTILACFTCKVNLCVKCIAAAVKDNIHSGHDMRDVEDARARLDDVNEKYKNSMGECMTLWGKFKTEREKFKLKVETAIEQVNKQADDIVNRVRELQRKVLGQIEGLKFRSLACDFSTKICDIKEMVNTLLEEDPFHFYYHPDAMERIIDGIPLKAMIEKLKDLDKEFHTQTEQFKYRQFTNIWAK
jgi:hypothetical protein